MNGNSQNIRKTIKAISSEVLNGENYSIDDFARSLLNYPAMIVPSVQEPIIEELSYAINEEISLLDKSIKYISYWNEIGNERIWSRY